MRRWRRPGLLLALVAVGLALAGLRGLTAGSRLRTRAEAAEQAGDWSGAIVAWRAYNASERRRDVATMIREARANLAMGRAAEADRVLSRACVVAPREPRPWLLRLELCRAQGRLIDALNLGRQALVLVVGAAARRDVLRDLTLALLADLPDDSQRQTLSAWVAADAEDLDSQVALLRRIAASPRADDPPRPERIARLERLLKQSPEHPGVREALVEELADGGEPERGRKLLETWPLAFHDARYDRLRGRWALEYDNQPALAVEHLDRSLRTLPQDGPSRYRLIRALQILNRTDEARAQAQILNRIRETLEPNRLEPRIRANLRTLDESGSRHDMAELCHQVGLDELAAEWLALGTRPVPH